jgi:hypothetical protein
MEKMTTAMALSMTIVRKKAVHLVQSSLVTRDHKPRETKAFVVMVFRLAGRIANGALASAKRSHKQRSATAWMITVMAGLTKGVGQSASLVKKASATLDQLAPRVKGVVKQVHAYARPKAHGDHAPAKSNPPKNCATASTMIAMAPLTGTLAQRVPSPDIVILGTSGVLLSKIAREIRCMPAKAFARSGKIDATTENGRHVPVRCCQRQRHAMAKTTTVMVPLIQAVKRAVHLVPKRPVSMDR